MKKWILLRRGADFEGLSKELNIDKVAVRILINRGLDTVDKMRSFLNCGIDECTGYNGLPDIDKAVSFIRELKAENTGVRIIGDYDADGVCATTILMKGLQKFGLDADFAIPHRIINGYGLSAELIEDAYRAGRNSIITCDNGIAAVDAVSLANSKGMRVFVTDHHEVPKSEDGTEEILPKAVGIVNPKRKDSTYPMKDICGAYVAFKVICALFGYDRGIPDEDGDFFEEILELAAIATVCDVMPLVGENRGIVSHLLDRIGSTPNPGLKQLLEVTGLNGKKYEPYHISFIIGPHINATGRLDTAMRAMNLLMSPDRGVAFTIANELHEINEKRKQMTSEWVEKAVNIVEKESLNDRNVIVLYLEGCHESLAGLVAGKIKEQFYRPVFVFTDALEGIKGSGRSIEEFDMFANLEKCKSVLSHYGGHKMAAGLSLPKENLESFTEMINNCADYGGSLPVEQIAIDADMPLDYVTVGLVEDINRLEPFGMGNEKPIFARKDIKILSAERKTDTMLILKVSDESYKSYKMIYFGNIDEFERFIDAKHGKGASQRMYAGDVFAFNAAYMPKINEFRGVRSVEFQLKDYC